MKRDLDLVRLILLDLEAQPEPTSGNYVYTDASKAEVSFNLSLMLEQGLILAQIFQPLAGYASFHNVRLTWAGSDFLDTVRDDEIWRRTKDAARKARGFTFDLLKQLATGLVKTQLEKHTGVKLGS